MRTITSYPKLDAALGYESEMYKQIIPSAMKAHNLERSGPYEDLIPLAILYHASLPGRSSPFWGYMEELKKVDMSGQPMYKTTEQMFQRYPELFPNGEAEDRYEAGHDQWVEYYFITTRRFRRHLETDFPEIFGPHILVRGQPILCDENQIWASQLYISRSWSKDEYDLFEEGGELRGGKRLLGRGPSFATLDICVGLDIDAN